MSRKITIGALAVGLAAAMSSSVFAGSCPADKVKAGGHKPVASKGAGVNDRVIASIDLEKEAPRLKDRKFRLRRLVIQPGGVVPWHSHGERPAIIYVVSGTIVEYSSTCSVPIKHRAGEVTTETHTVSHWWKNHSRRPVVLLSADIIHEKDDQHTM